MSRIGELMALFLQESEEAVRSTRTIVELLRERTMDGPDRLRRRKSLHERLGLKSMVCCGSTWGLGSSTISTGVASADDDGNDTDVVDSIHQQMDVINMNPDSSSDHDCIFPSPRMNLAAALAAERNFRSTTVTVDGGGPLSPSDVVTNDRLPRMSTVEGGTPLRISLMRLLEESDGHDEKEKEKEGLGRDLVCCVCMGRKKGAAFIPCGHTFCRVCSRELWLNRGTCPLCNRSIFEILDIY
ncbi:hypothetical protein L6452_19546 [Arctium lappa]|uniref:Uncharacterized protein n=1 Tax=Arctium lappa TaxID=4217 RepID=A0ACB9B8C4_ARCLA|nr:hypothetical protein L6452_19546 [Arctium lappa]